MRARQLLVFCLRLRALHLRTFSHFHRSSLLRVSNRDHVQSLQRRNHSFTFNIFRKNAASGRIPAAGRLLRLGIGADHRKGFGDTDSGGFRRRRSIDRFARCFHDDNAVSGGETPGAVSLMFSKLREVTCNFVLQRFPLCRSSRAAQRG